MEEKIVSKIEEVVDHIISKPVAEVTLNDYTILHEELKDIRFRQEQKASNERIQQIMAATGSGFFGSVK